MKIFKLIIIILFCMPIKIQAYPVIKSLNNTELNDGATIIISGSGFLSHPLDIHWLGGSSGNIETGNINQEIKLPEDWTSETTSSSRQRPIYSNEEKHSGSKSIKSFFPTESVYTSGFSLINNNGFGAVYATWWFKAKPLTWKDGNVSPVGQFKMFRITPGLGGGIYADQPHNWYWTQQLNNTSIPPVFEDGQNLLINFCRSSAIPTYDTSCYGGEYTSKALYRAVGPKTDIWQRIEVWSKQSSPNKQDGTISIKIHRSEEATPLSPVSFVNYINNTCTRETSDFPWKCVVWENYFGNGVDKGIFYFDDIYVQYNSQARIEIGNSPKWDSCTKREIQIPKKWNPRVQNYEAIEFVVNKGSFGSGVAYLYVIDKDGNPSNGMLITLK